jgi:hypothetical protein
MEMNIIFYKTVTAKCILIDEVLTHRRIHDDPHITVP